MLLPGGWFCAFTLTVTNEGPDDFDGPLTIHEALSVAPLATPSFTPPWICAAFKGGYDCSYPAGLQVPLAPHETASLAVGVLVPDDGSVCEIGNTASIGTPLAGNDANSDPSNDSASASSPVLSAKCPAPVEKKSDLKVEKSANGECTLGGDVEPIVTCHYQITVTNLGPDAYDGSFNVNDIPPVGKNTTIKPDDASWTCLPSPGKNAACQHLGKFEANVPALFSVQLEASLDKVQANGCKVTNSVSLSAKDDSDSSNNKADAEAILPNALCHLPGPAKKQSDLKIEKSVVGDCTLGGDPGSPMATCNYALVLTNTGPDDFDGSVEVDDIAKILGSVTISSAADPRWSCKSSGFTGVCTFTGKLANGEGSAANVHVASPLDQVQGHDCLVENTANLAKVEGANDNKSGNSTAATAVLPDKLCHPAPVEKPGGNIAITKLAQPCVLKDDHWECPFSVKLQNLGDVDGTLPIAIDETFPEGLTVYVLGAPILKCEGPTGNVVHCVLPPLTAGASFSFAVDVEVPFDYVEKGTCKIPNSVKITSPVKGDAGDENTANSDDSSTAVAKIDQVIPNPDPGGASWIIPCDPPALRIEKVANPEVCTRVQAASNAHTI